MMKGFNMAVGIMTKEELNLPKKKLEEKRDLVCWQLDEELKLVFKEFEEELDLLWEYNFDNNIRPENENVEKDELPKSKNVGKDESPENENVGKDESPESKYVGKDESLETKNVGKDKSPENENVGKKDESSPELRSYFIPRLPDLRPCFAPRFYGSGSYLVPEIILKAGTEEAGANNQEKLKKQKASWNYSPFLFARKIFGTAVIFHHMLSCAAESTTLDGPNKQQDLSEIYQRTLKKVDNCPNVNEYKQRAFDKCADVCGANIQDGECAYHCMRDSLKTNLYEFCAKPEPLFDYCPEFDPVDQTIQRDHETLCNSNSTRRVYKSSEIFFCDPGSCLKLIESTVRAFPTTTALTTKKPKMKSGGVQQDSVLYFVVFCMVALVSGALIFVFCPQFRKKCFECLKKRFNFKSPSDEDPTRNEPLM